MVEESSYVIKIMSESQEMKEGGPLKSKKSIATEYSQSSFSEDNTKNINENNNEDLGGGLRNKYKKKKRDSPDKPNTNTEEISSKVLEDEKELKKAIIDEIKNIKEDISDEKKNENKKEEVLKDENKTKTEIIVSELEITSNEKVKNDEIQSPISKNNSESDLKEKIQKNKKGEEITISKVSEISSIKDHENKEDVEKPKEKDDLSNNQEKSNNKGLEILEVIDDNQQNQNNKEEIQDDNNQILSKDEDKSPKQKITKITEIKQTNINQPNSNNQDNTLLDEKNVDKNFSKKWRFRQREIKKPEITETEQQIPKDENNQNNNSREKEKPIKKRFIRTSEETKDLTTNQQEPNQKLKEQQNKNKDKTSEQKSITITKIISKIKEVNPPNQSSKGNNRDTRDSNKPKEPINQNKNREIIKKNQEQRIKGQFPNKPINKNDSKPNLNKPNYNQQNLMNQKSAQNIRGKVNNQNKNEKKPNNRLKDNKNKPISPIPQNQDQTLKRNNTFIYFIDETGKIPKKEYVLNVRKLDIIKDNRRHKRTYNDTFTPESSKPFISEYNHKTVVIKNVTKDLKTVADVDYKINHRYNYTNLTAIPNKSFHTINESGKIPKKQKAIFKRKIDVIKSEKKPHKLDYTLAEVRYDGKRFPITSIKNDLINNINVRSAKNINAPRGDDKNKIQSNNMNKFKEQQPRGRNNNNNNQSQYMPKEKANENTRRNDKFKISTENRTKYNKQEKPGDSSIQQIKSSRIKNDSISGLNRNTKEITKSEKTNISRRTGPNGKPTQENIKFSKTLTTETNDSSKLQITNESRIVRNVGNNPKNINQSKNSNNANTKKGGEIKLQITSESKRTDEGDNNISDAKRVRRIKRIIGSK